MRYSDRIIVGKRITFSIRRDGKIVERSQTVTRIKGEIVWCGAFCYHIDEFLAVRL